MVAHRVHVSFIFSESFIAWMIHGNHMTSESYDLNFVIGFMRGMLRIIIVRRTPHHPLNILYTAKSKLDPVPNAGAERPPPAYSPCPRSRGVFSAQSQSVVVHLVSFCGL